MEIKNKPLPERNEICIDELSITYSQMQDHAIYNDKLDDQKLKIKTVDADGMGYYYVIETERWAFDDINELVKVFEDFKKRLGIE